MGNNQKISKEDKKEIEELADAAWSDIKKEIDEILDRNDKIRKKLKKQN